MSVSAKDTTVDEMSKLLFIDVVHQSKTAAKSFSIGRYTLTSSGLHIFTDGPVGRREFTGEFSGDRLVLTNKDGIQREFEFHPMALQ